MRKFGIRSMPIGAFLCIEFIVMLMQRKRHCAPIEEIGVTLDRMIPEGGMILTIAYLLAIAGVAGLFSLQLFHL